MKRITGLRGIRISNRPYSKSPFSFIPNEDKHIFESEKLTPEQNDAAIPPKPDFSGVSKYHHDMKNPEDIADLVTKFSFNDFMISSLSKNATIHGDTNHKFVLKNEESGSQSISLHFTNMAKTWVELFNAQIIPLSNISSVQELNLSSNSSELTKKLEEFEVANGNIYSDADKLNKFYKSLGAFSREGGLQDYLTNRQAAGSISFESVSNFLVGREEIRENEESFKTLISYIEGKLSNCSAQGVTPLLITLIDNISGFKDISSEISTSHLQIFDAFVDRLDEVFGSVITSLDAKHLDKLAYLLILNSNLNRSKGILSLMIQKDRVCPSSKTLDKFFSSYEVYLKLNHVEYNEVVRDLTPLKSTLFHTKLTSTLFNVVLEFVVRDQYELDQFLKLFGTEKALLQESQFDLISKLLSIHKQGSVDAGQCQLELSQLVRRLVEEGEVTFNEETSALIEKAYTR